MKNTKVIGLVTIAGLSLGTLSMINNQKVDAASTYKVQLTHNAAIYNNKGKRNSRIILKKGKILSVYSVRNIKGKRYYHLTKGRYIKRANAKKYIVKSKNSLFTVNVPDAIKARQTPNGKELDVYVAGKHKIYEQKSDSQGTMWYRIGTNQWINSQSTDRSKIVNLSNNTSDNSNSEPPKPDLTNIADSNSVQNNKTINTSTITVPTLDRETIEETGRYFVQLVNEWRKTQGVAPVTYDTARYSYDIQRAVHDANAWDTTQQPDYHVGVASTYGEVSCLINYSTPQEMAQNAFNMFIYKDASSNYGHRNILKMANLSNIGLGLALTTKNGLYQNGIAFVASVKL